jgi:hypothetical protein
MTPDTLAALIIRFCNVHTQAEMYNTPEKKACVFFVMNCSVDDKGQILPDVVKKCTAEWAKNKTSLIKQFGD